MYIFSEKTNKKYETVAECIAAEKEYDDEMAKQKKEKEELARVKKTRHEEVVESYKKAVAAIDEYESLAEKYAEDYGTFSMTTDGDVFHSSLLKFFNSIF